MNTPRNTPVHKALRNASSLKLVAPRVDDGDDGDLRRVLDEAFHWLSNSEETGGELEKYVELHRDRLNKIASRMITLADEALQICLPFELKQDRESD